MVMEVDGIAPMENLFVADFQLELAMEKHDLTRISRFLRIYEQLPSLHNNNHVKALIASAELLLESWKVSLNAGHYADYYDPPPIDKWYLVKVVRRDADILLVHYLGWDQEHDKSILLSTSNLRPPYTFTKRRLPGKRVMRITESESAIEVNVVEGNETPAAKPPEVSRSGRIIKKLVSNVEEVKKRRKDKRSGGVTGARDKFRFGEDGVTRLRPDNNESLCPICFQLESKSDEASLSVLCDGACKRTFHVKCLGLETLPDKEWLCDECTSGCHTCFACKSTGIDVKEMRCCSVGTCGKHFHYDCLKQCTLFQITGQSSSASTMAKIEAGYEATIGNGAKTKRLTGNKRKKRKDVCKEAEVEVDTEEKEEEGEVHGFRFKCPHHYCDVCFAFYGEQVKEKGALMECLLCPVAYHVGCIPPTARFNEYYLLCDRHSDSTLPSYDRVSDHISSRTSNTELWEQLYVSDHNPRQDVLTDGHFMLPASIKEEVEIYAPDFVKISQLEYDSLPDGIQSAPFHEAEATCDCKLECGSNCYNRLNLVECYTHCPGVIKKNCGLEGGPGGGRGNQACSNRQMQNRDYAETVRFSESGRGTGLLAKTAITRGQLIIEYIGEVIDDVEMERRMKAQRDLTPNDHEYYIMQLENKIFVDGKHKGNESRFINHSCDPNCELVPWTVRGRKRIGIFAIRDIPAGEALSYDYQFDCNEASEFRCLCGAACCRGTMAPASRANKDLNRSERERMRRLGRSMMKLTEEDLVEAEWTRSLTGALLPGDPLLEVREGPFLPGNVLSAGLLLRRNTKRGKMFHVRHRRLADPQSSHHHRHRPVNEEFFSILSKKASVEILTSSRMTSHT